MTKNITLKAETRKEGTDKPTPLREAGLLPAVIYGQGEEAVSLKIKANDFVSAYDVAGESSLINLEIDGGEPIKAIIKDAQRHPVQNSFVHADIFKVNMKEKIEIEIPLNFIGESKAEKELGGTLVKSYDSITGSCLPGDLVESIDVDISKLVTLDDAIKVSDLELPSGVEILIDPSAPIAQVTIQKVEEEPEPEEETTDEEDGKEKEAPAEGGEEKTEEKAEEKK